MIEIITTVKDDEWKTFLNDCNTATIYHTPEWKKILEETFNYKSYYLFAKDESGKMVGLLPLFYVKSRLAGNRLCSAPFAHICGPIGDKSSISLMINQGINIYEDLGADFFEIRSNINYDKFHNQNEFCTHVLELSNNPENIFKMFKRDVIRGVKKSEQNRVKVNKTKNIKDLKEYFELNCKTKREIGVPGHNWKFLKNLFNILGDNVLLYVAEYENEIIAGGIMEYFKNTILYGYAAANSDYLHLFPYNALIWKSIKEGCLNGYKYYDFGRTSITDSGLRHYKNRWGPVETKIDYSYYPKKINSLTGNRDNIKYRMATKLIQNIPMPIYKTFSDAVFGSFG